MEIEYNLKKQYFKYCNYANGAYLQKRKIEKNPDKKIHTATKHLFCYLMIVIIFSVVSEYIIISCNIESQVFIGFIAELIGLAIGTIVFCLIFLVIYSLYKELKNPVGVVKLDALGIHDSSNGITISLDWDHIELIIIEKDIVIVFAKKSYLVLVFPNKDEKKFIKTVKKYNKDILLVNKNQK